MQSHLLLRACHLPWPRGRQHASSGCGTARWVFRVSMPGPVRVALVEAMADVEHRLAVGTSERLQLGALVAAFVTARAGIAAAAVWRFQQRRQQPRVARHSFAT